MLRERERPRRLAVRRNTRYVKALLNRLQVHTAERCMERYYLIRYGVMGKVGRFEADHGEAYERGCTVVVRSHRGTELGEVLANATSGARDVGSFRPARILRVAGPDDIERARLVAIERHRQFEACEHAFRDGIWPFELIDVEPLLDHRRTVLHYLGPHRLDVEGVIAALSKLCDLEVVLQPVGRDVTEKDEVGVLDSQVHSRSCGSCSAAGSRCSVGTSCGDGGGCSDCGVKKLLTAGR